MLATDPRRRAVEEIASWLDGEIDFPVMPHRATGNGQEIVVSIYTGNESDKFYFDYYIYRVNVNCCGYSEDETAAALWEAYQKLKDDYGQVTTTDRIYYLRFLDQPGNVMKAENNYWASANFEMRLELL